MAGKPTPDTALPEITLPRLGGGEITLGKPLEGRDWKMVVVYRGKHCPVCHKYVSGLEPLLPKFHDAGIDVVLVSGDPERRLAPSPTRPAPRRPWPTISAWRRC